MTGLLLMLLAIDRTGIPVVHAPVAPTSVIVLDGGLTVSVGSINVGTVAIDGGFVYVDQRSTSNPWAVSGNVNAKQDGAWSVTTSGTATVSGAVTVLGNVTVDGGHIVIDNFPASQAVTGTFWQSTQPVSIASMPSTPVTGTFYQATQPVSGTVATTQSGTWTSLDSQGVSRDGGFDWSVASKLIAADGTAIGTSGAPVRIDPTGTTAQPVTGNQGDGNLTGSQFINVLVARDSSSGVMHPLTMTGTKLLVTPDSVALPANQSTNVAQVNGTTTDTNSGTKSAGTLRVVLATDQPALTNKLLVTPDSVALPANQSVNVSQINGVTPLMGNGATGTGALRVSIANDSTGIVALTTGSAQIGHLEANQSENMAQIAGVAPVMAAASTAGAAADRALVVSLTPNGGNPCQNPSATLAAVAGATSGTSAVQLIAISGSTKIYICSVNITGVSGTTPTFSLVYGTGSNCATGQVKFLGSWTTAANTIYSFIRPFVTPAGQAVCYLDTGTTPVQNYNITYVQQ